jgi:hypothetical protein
MGNQGPLPRDFPGLHVDQALPLTLQENLRRTKTDRLIQLSTRGFYRPNAQGEQTLTERTLVETLIVMHEHITAVENDAMRERAARVLAEERLRNSELLVRLLQSEAAAKETQGVKRPDISGILDITKFNTLLINLLGPSHTLLRVCPWLSTLRVNLAVSCALVFLILFL